ncbi:uncharacterized protein BO88DRAFT_57558 [Aspergillus vadensis CBS 113365]|uniref:Uncharacterized protein n=1 Tax=Aspergillus vadensis (strain CBS 113365 / IMI 142717 / IBT 24658) TaxID=1448311 RepID=A0A319B7C1_ASPVC|nr:hypothetical protein BO88DRAFT_57558 [Aspergillus vadensis CBS 113365]PYH68405.1 hypothetical protein BO88DRAFT_57558 [Aspergillus vadensis CBS 113365]
MESNEIDTHVLPVHELVGSYGFKVVVAYLVFVYGTTKWSWAGNVIIQYVLRDILGCNMSYTTLMEFHLLYVGSSYVSLGHKESTLPRVVISGGKRKIKCRKLKPSWTASPSRNAPRQNPKPNMNYAKT